MLVSLDVLINSQQPDNKMAVIKVGIVEDEFLIAFGISETLKELGYDVTSVANNYTEALAMIAQEKPDILLIDIQLGGYKDGIDLAWKVRKDHNMPFIFLTSNTDPATVERAKKVSPNAYLVKPYNKHDLYTSIEICLHNYLALQKQSNESADGDYLVKDSVFIKQGQHFHKVNISDILYIESDNVYVNVYTSDAKLMVRSSIQEYLDLLGSKNFFRVHRSYAVNLRHIQIINSEYIIINDTQIPVGKSYRDELLNMLKTT